MRKNKKKRNDIDYMNGTTSQKKQQQPKINKMGKSIKKHTHKNQKNSIL